MQIKKIVFIISALFLALSMSACYDSTEVDDMVYVLAIGIDEKDDEGNMYTFQTAVPLNISGGVETGFAESEESVTVQNISVIADNLYSAIEKINSKLAKELSVTHCKILFFSDNSSTKTIKNNITTINRYNEFSPDMLVAICSGSTLSYMDSISSPFEKNPARFYNMFFNKDFSLYSFKTRIIEFEKKRQLLLPLVKINQPSVAVVVDNISITSILSERDTLAMNILSGKFKKGYIAIADDTSAEIHLISSPKIIVDTKSNNPHFIIKLKLNGNLSVTDTESSQNKQRIQNYIQKACLDFLKKSATEYKTDVVGLIKYSLPGFKTSAEYEQYNWQEKYPKSDFDVEVSFT